MTLDELGWWRGCPQANEPALFPELAQHRKLNIEIRGRERERERDEEAQIAILPDMPQRLQGVLTNHTTRMFALESSEKPFTNHPMSLRLLGHPESVDTFDGSGRRPGVRTNRRNRCIITSVARTSSL